MSRAGNGPHGRRVLGARGRVRLPVPLLPSHTPRGLTLAPTLPPPAPLRQVGFPNGGVALYGHYDGSLGRHGQRYRIRLFYSGGARRFWLVLCVRFGGCPCALGRRTSWRAMLLLPS